LPYVTIAAVCSVFLYISYVLPTAIGFFAHGRTWTAMGPWHIGRWYRPLAVLSTLGCRFLIVIGTQPPNQQAVSIVGGSVARLRHARVPFRRDGVRSPPAAVEAKLENRRSGPAAAGTREKKASKQ